MVSALKHELGTSLLGSRVVVFAGRPLGGFAHALTGDENIPRLNPSPTSATLPANGLAHCYDASGRLVPVGLVRGASFERAGQSWPLPSPRHRSVVVTVDLHACLQVKSVPPCASGSGSACASATSATSVQTVLCRSAGLVSLRLWSTRWHSHSSHFSPVVPPPRVGRPEFT